LLLFFADGLSCFSQGFQLIDRGISLSNGDDLFLSGPSDTLQLITWLSISNLTGDSLNVLMKKEEIDMLPEASTSICWAGYCFDPTIMISMFPLSMPQGETVSGCFGHFAPNGGRGVSVVRWTFFKADNPNDSISVTSHYSTYPSAIEDLTGGDLLLTNAGPNPANDKVVLRHSLPQGKAGRIELRSLYGNLVSSAGNISLSAFAVFNTEALDPGLYFCSLIIDGKNAATIKVQVHH
jgi:hypothetical protein